MTKLSLGYWGLNLHISRNPHEESAGNAYVFLSPPCSKFLSCVLRIFHPFLSLSRLHPRHGKTPFFPDSTKVWSVRRTSWYRLDHSLKNKMLNMVAMGPWEEEGKWKVTWDWNGCERKNQLFSSLPNSLPSNLGVGDLFTCYRNKNDQSVQFT